MISFAPPTYLCDGCCPLFIVTEPNHTHWPEAYILGVSFQGSCQVTDKVKGTVMFYKEFRSFRVKGPESHNSGALFAEIINQCNIPKTKIRVLEERLTNKSYLAQVLDKRNMIEQSTDFALKGKLLPLGKIILESCTLTFTDTPSTALI